MEGGFIRKGLSIGTITQDRTELWQSRPWAVRGGNLIVLHREWHGTINWSASEAKYFNLTFFLFAPNLMLPSSEEMVFQPKDSSCPQRTRLQCTLVKETESCSIWQTVEPVVGPSLGASGISTKRTKERKQCPSRKHKGRVAWNAHKRR